MLKRLLLVLTIFNFQFSIFNSFAQDVMLQGFYWDSFTETRWTRLEKQAETLGHYFNYVWVPNSGYCSDSGNMGYLPLYYWNQTSTFGNEAELRSMITTFKQNGIGTIADVVINHHNSLGWFDFPKETYKGETYQFLSTDICRNDDGGATLTQANKDGVSLSANDDTGEGWDGCRDLDHASANVKRIIKAYEDFLLNDLGYAGFRYDMVKGFGAGYVREYNVAAKPQFSVGEYWDSSTKIKNWIDGTSSGGTPTSAAFDFQFRYRVRDAFNNGNCTNLIDNTKDAANRPLAYQKSYKKWAVTFVENHDTQYRSASEPLDPLKKDTVAANAYMLSMPGTPCVFLKHWIDCKSDIRRQIAARQVAGITCESEYTNIISSGTVFSNIVTGTNGSLIVVVGSGATKWTPADYSTTHAKVLTGHHYAIWLSNELVATWNTRLAQIEAEEKAEQTEEEQFQPYTITIYCKADFTPVYFYAWDTKSILNDWPGKLMTGQTKVIDGETWYYQDFTIKTKDYEVNIIFNQGSGKPQTSDIKGITSDKFYTATITGGKVVYQDVTADHTTAIMSLSPALVPMTGSSYDLSGRKVNAANAHGIYIRNGKKIIK